ncbi:MAG: exodeoxyribonuclease III [Candidatus Moranbacteria bacterium]|nr:exodeoxyribonuclease III [Candidatus Moranbacteria bacterium]
MKIITWNVNGLRAVERKGEIQKLVENENPDFLFLQEIKGKKEQFSEFLTENKIYSQFYHSAEKAGYAGTGIWAKKTFLEKCDNINFDTEVPKNPVADEGRISHLSFSIKNKKYHLLSIYFPNGGKSEQAWAEKLIFFDRVLDFMNELRKDGGEVIIGGDMNVAHREIDLARPKANDGRIGFHPEERAWVDQVLKNGWLDVWRSKNFEVENIYSYWDMKTRARDRNVGWRIDYFFADEKILRKVKEIKYISEQMGSDHCPLMIEL